MVTLDSNEKKMLGELASVFQSNSNNSKTWGLRGGAARARRSCDNSKARYARQHACLALLKRLVEQTVKEPRRLVRHMADPVEGIPFTIGRSCNGSKLIEGPG